MKIIKKVDVSTWKYPFTCLNCETEMEVEKQDIAYRYYEGDMRDPGYDNFSFNCPVCQNNYNIPASKLPKLLQVEIKNKGK